MKIRLLVFTTLFIPISIIRAQVSLDYETIDKKVNLISPESTTTSLSIAKYINQTFKTGNEKIRAIFCWIANNIKYDLDYKYVEGYNNFSEKSIEQTLKTKKAVCEGYAALFKDIADKAGFTSYIVFGYVKQDTQLLDRMHAWNAVLVDGKWKLYDATWGAGYILNGKYIAALNNDYFDSNPRNMIKSHKPFDPMWQLLNYIWTDKEFAEGKECTVEKKFFNYDDSIKVFLKLTEVEKTKTIVRRIEENGLSNALIITWYDYYNKMIHYYQNCDFVTSYNKSVELYNNAQKKYSDFIIYRQGKFNPLKSELQIRNMIKEIDSLYAKSGEIILSILPYDDNSKMNIQNLSIKIKSAQRKAEGQRNFINKYFETPKNMRFKLFYP